LVSEANFRSVAGQRVDRNAVGTAGWHTRQFAPSPGESSLGSGSRIEFYLEFYVAAFGLLCGAKRFAVVAFHLACVIMASNGSLPTAVLFQEEFTYADGLFVPQST